jgi:CelD/BcsL family acetyltransferase involved in cellulose biosynthesis
MALEWITEPTRFQAVAAAWDRLADSDRTPFARHAWYSSWWEAFGHGRRLSVCALWAGDDLLAAFPLVRRGSRLEAMANVHTPLFRPLARDLESLEAVVHAVLAASASEVDAPALPADDPALAALVAESRRTGRLTLIEHQHTSPIVDLEDDFADYRRRMKSKLGPIERKGRKLEREYGPEFRLLSPPADFESELERGFEVEAAGWKGKSGTAVLSSADTGVFYRSVARAFHAKGELALSSISLDGRVIAFSLGLLHRGRLYLLKTAYDESFGPVAPGMVLRMAIVERCFELGLEAHELLGDDTAWKRRFATSGREHRGFYSYRRRPKPVLRYWYRKAIRPLLKRARGAAQERLGRS